MKTKQLSSLKNYNNMPTLTKTSYYLILVNLIPIFGVAFFGWSLFDIMLSYWVENLVIGFYTVLKIALAQRGGMGFAKWFVVPFFIIHFGGFTLGHGVFVFALFGPVGVFGAGSVLNIMALVVMAISYMVSHGISFWRNYIQAGEYRQAVPMFEMSAPYGRVMVMHAVVMGSAFAFALLGVGSLSKFIIISLKTILDYWSHRRQHARFAF